MTRSKIISILIIGVITCASMAGIYLIANYIFQSSGKNRIISIAAACTEIIYAIGAGDKLVGVDQYSIDYASAGQSAFEGAPGELNKFPMEVPNITNVGTTSSLNVELVVSLDTSLVFSWSWASTANNALEDRNITVFKIYPKTLADVMNLTTTIGYMLGKTANAAAVNQEIQDRIDNITTEVENVTAGEKPLVYYELSTFGKSVGNTTITHEMITLAGGINLAANETGYPTLSSEYIVARNPDVIVVVSYGATVNDIKARAGWDNITAVKNDAVYSIESGWVTASPRLVLGLEQFLAWFYPP